MNERDILLIELYRAMVEQRPPSPYVFDQFVGTLPNDQREEVIRASQRNMVPAGDDLNHGFVESPPIGESGIGQDSGPADGYAGN